MPVCSRITLVPDSQYVAPTSYVPRSIDHSYLSRLGLLIHLSFRPVLHIAARRPKLLLLTARPVCDLLLISYFSTRAETCQSCCCPFLRLIACQARTHPLLGIEYAKVAESTGRIWNPMEESGRRWKRWNSLHTTSISFYVTSP
jgi:hypothetical protein